MDQVAAYGLLNETIMRWKECCFTDLTRKIDQTVSDRVQANDGHAYIVDATFRWKNQDRQAIEIYFMISTDDTGPLRRIDKTVTIQSE